MIKKNIKFNLSKDYSKLYELIKSGKVIVGVKEAEKDYSKVGIIKKKDAWYNIFGYSIHEDDTNKSDFIKDCKKINFKFFNKTK